MQISSGLWEGTAVVAVISHRYGKQSMSQPCLSSQLQPTAHLASKLRSTGTLCSTSVRGKALIPAEDRGFSNKLRVWCLPKGGTPWSRISAAYWVRPSPWEAHASQLDLKGFGTVLPSQSQVKLEGVWMQKAAGILEKPEPLLQHMLAQSEVIPSCPPSRKASRLH